MSHVDVEVNGRMFRLVCEDGQEARIRELCEIVDRRVRAFTSGGRQGSDAQMLLVAAIQIADELSDTLRGREEARARGRIDDEAAENADRRVADLARVVAALSDRVETVASGLPRA